MGNKTKLPLILFTVLLLIALSIFSYWFINKNGYTYVSPRKGELVEAIYGLGKVKSYRKYDIKVGIITKVKNVYVKEGQSVTKGDPLIQFTDTAIFKAPFSGTVTQLLNNVPDDIVLPQATILTLQDLTQKYLEVSLEQEGALRVTKGQLAKVLFESLRGEVFEGKVYAIFPKDDEFLAHIEVPGLRQNVLPGMTADVSIIVGEHKDALLVPVSSLSSGHIIIRRDGEKMKLPIVIGGIDGEWAEVLEGDVQMSDEVYLKIDKNHNEGGASALFGH